MSRSALKGLQAAAGAAGGDSVYVEDVFSTFLHTGGLSSPKVIASGIDLSGEGGLVWTKNRTSSASNQLTDTVSGYRLESDDTAAGEASQSNVTFNSDGHSYSGYSSFFNGGSEDYVSWTFRKQPGFFDIQTYTGSGENGQVINHDLDAVPGMVIVKQITGSAKWYVYHRSLASGKHLKLNSTNPESSDSNYEIGKTTCTSTQFSIDTGSEIDSSGQTYVAYFFAHDDQRFGTDSDEAIIKCGSITMDSSGEASINLGFEPQWMLIKKSTGTGGWTIVDSMRGMISGGNDSYLEADSTAAEATYAFVDLTATGANIHSLTSSETYVYVAIRRPNKPASEFAATDLFAVNNGDGSTVPGFTSGFPVDMAWERRSNGTDDTQLSTRLLGETALKTNSKDAEASAGSRSFDYMNGWLGYAEGTDWYSWMLRRAPGFFDVVCYKGTGGAVWHNHNLGVVPEMIWCKGRDIAEYWNVFTTAGGTSSRLRLNEGSEYLTSNASQFFPSLPTATQFRVGQNNEIGGSGYNYIAYLFASVAGISKLGTYTGTGSAQDIDCGFSAGARFVLIKRVDVAGYWILFDSLRGIVAGNDPYLFLNTTAAQTTNTDYIDPLSSGFTITSSAPADNSDASMNKSGGTYLFYAIA